MSTPRTSAFRILVPVAERYYGYGHEWGGSNLVRSVTPPHFVLPGPLCNPFLVEDTLDMSVMTREGLPYSGRR